MKSEDKQKSLCNEADISDVTLQQETDSEYSLDTPALSLSNTVSDASVPYQTGTSPTAEATSADYWSLPENTRAELLDGKLHYMEAPITVHQALLSELFFTIKMHIKQKGEPCMAIPAPYAVNLNADDKT